jgi:ComF family protein
VANCEPKDVAGTSAEEGMTAVVARLLAHGLRGVADFVLPPVCIACREPLDLHDALCAACWREIDFIRPPLCDRLGLPLPFDIGGVMVSAAAAARPPAYDRARAVAQYSGVMRALIHGLKFRDRHDARRLFGRWLVDAGADLLREAEVIVPVPLGRWRLLSRRFNQAAILAGEIARRTGTPFAPLALARVRGTRSQVGLTRLQRRANVAGAFAVPARSKSSVSGRRVLLVDDVITTGATVGACAEALRRARAVKVDVLALAIVTDLALIPG